MCSVTRIVSREQCEVFFIAEFSRSFATVAGAGVAKVSGIEAIAGIRGG